jgi:hypothetical protein
MPRTRGVDVSPNKWIKWYRDCFEECFHYIARDAMSCLVVSVPRKERLRAMKGCQHSFDYMWENLVLEITDEARTKGEYPPILDYPDISYDN